MNGATIAIGEATDNGKTENAQISGDSFNRRTLLAALWVFVGYYLGAKLGLDLKFRPHPVSVLWPPNSILVAALLLTSPRIWWVFFLAALPAHWLVQFQDEIPSRMIVCWYVSNCSEALLGAGVARLLIGEPMRFNRLRNVGVFCLCVAFIGPFLSSFLDAAFVVWNRFGEGSYWELWKIRLISNVLAALTVAPLIVSWASDGRLLLYKLTIRRSIEGGVLFVLLLLVSFMVLYQFDSGTNWFLPYLSLPFLLWAALRFGSPGASTAIATVAFLTIWSAAHGHGPFSGGAPEQNAISVQIFLIALAVPILFLGTLSEELVSGEMELLESEMRFRVVADAAPVLVWTAGIDKNCTFVNKAWREFTGRKLEQDLGDGWAESVHPDDSELCLSTITTAYEARKPFSMKYRLRRNDGEYRFVTDTGVPNYGPQGTFRGYIGACVDVTDLLQQQKALHEFEETIALAAEAAHLGVWERDLVNDRFWISDKLRELFQFDPSEAVTYAQFRARAHPEDIASSDFARDHAIKTKTGYDLEYRIILPDGSVRWIAGRARCMLDENRKVARLLGVAIDVTEQKLARHAAEEQARNNREEINRLSRISLLGEMTGSIAHELNQPLSGIISNANAGQRFIDRGDADLGEIREILADIVADGRRASDVMAHIRNTIKNGAPMREPININDVVTRVAHIVQPETVSRSCELQVSLAENLPAIQGDPIQIQQVLINLVTNACDAMRDIPVGQRKVKISTENGANAVKVQVRDHGPGVSEEVREHLFDQFFTTKKEGLGMGLAIVRSVIESHGGKIDMQNLNGDGACFFFSLPAIIEVKK